MQGPSQLPLWHNCWNATNDCWILMENVLSMGICAFTKAPRLPSRGNIWTTVVGWDFCKRRPRNKVENCGGLRLWAGKTLHFSWLPWATWAASSALIWRSDQTDESSTKTGFILQSLGWSQHHLAGAINYFLFVLFRSGQGSLLCFLPVEEMETHNQLS